MAISYAKVRNDSFFYKTCLAISCDSKGLFIDYVNQLGGRGVSQKMTEVGEGVWQKMTDDDDGAGGRRQNTLTALQDTLTIAN